MVGKQLSALLQILKSNGVTHYQTPEITLDLSASGPRTPGPVAEQPAGGEEEDDDIGDPRFLLERLGSDFGERRAARNGSKG